ncbi:MAG: DHHA1 domain-containing protein [Oscillospiraceae bacterium]
MRTGLRLLKNTENHALDLLLDQAAVKREAITAQAVAFGIAPRINAAGRFGSPKTALEAFVGEDPEEISALVDQLSGLNTRRRAAEAEILAQIYAHIDAHPQLAYERVLVLDGTGWHHGVIGIIAAKVLERFGKPCIILSTDDGVTAKGSARSFKGFHIYHCLAACAALLKRFGGHECAGGLELPCDNIPALRAAVAQYAACEAPTMPALTLTADKLLTGADFDLAQVESLAILEPFGEGNPQPVFAALGAKAERLIPLSQGKHTKIEFSYDGIKQSALLFSRAPETLGIAIGDRIDLLMTLEVSTYGGQKSVAAKLMDFRPSGIKQEPFFAAKDCYERFLRGEKIEPALVAKIVPSRAELVDVYKLMGELKTATAEKLFAALFTKHAAAHPALGGMNFCKLKLCADIFAEAGLVSHQASTDTYTVLPVTKKADLEATVLLQRLRKQV